MAASDIVIRGAREHNLRDIDLRLPRNQLIVMTGVSGSGKSSLAFDTLYAEGQRRYVESLSSYARQFLGQMPKPEVDSITGLAPSISIQQKMRGRNPRSTVGTITEIYDYLRVLFARVGQAFCHRCGRPITAQTSERIIESIARLPEGAKFQVLAPLVQQQKGEYRDLFDDLLKQGFLRARVDGSVMQLSDDLKLDRQMKHTIEVVVDRLVAGKTGRTRLAEAVETALRLSGGTLIAAVEGRGSRVEGHEAPTDPQPSTIDPQSSTTDRLYSARYACIECGIGYEEPTPQLFSFNSPLGMCLECNGLGRRHDFVLKRLVPNPRKSVARGAIELWGSFGEVGRWRKHIYRGAANAIEQDLGLDTDSLLKSPWNKLPEEARQRFLYGTGDRHITFAWRHSGGIWKHGGTWQGVVPELLDSYRKAKNPMRRRQLEKYMEFLGCPACAGTRLNAQARAVRITSASWQKAVGSRQKAGKPAGSAPRDIERPTSHSALRTPHSALSQPSLNLPEVCALSIGDAAAFFEELALDATGRLIAGEVLKEIRGRIGFLLKCGLDYLALDRTAPTLSGGESQRIRLAGQIGCGLVGVVYILDEPSIGLHPRDNDLLLSSLLDLRDQGNTVIVVEHDEETMRAADHIVDFGPGPGVRGGEVVVTGTLEDVQNEPKSVTGQFLSGKRSIAMPEKRREPNGKSLRVVGATHHNLKNVDVTFPLGMLTCVTGVSGSGKSSLVNDILWKVLNKNVNQGKGRPGKHESVEGLDHLDKAIDIDQSPIGRTPRSNPATYVKLFDEIRRLFTRLSESKVRGYQPGRFSFNVAGGRCEACQGYGSNKLEMDFLADIWVTCPVCNGKRFNHETLEVRYKGRNIAEILDMDVQQALEHFRNVPKLVRPLQTLHDVGLDYLKLGQASPTLSGGEAQRIKLARELGKRSTGRTIYLLDEPTTGLHFADIHHLLEVLHGLVDRGNTVIVVEHNLDVIKTADWVIDLGPEGGAGGGEIVVEGPPEKVAACAASHTGRALALLLDSRAATAARSVARTTRGRSGRADANGKRIARATADRCPPAMNIVIRGAAQHNLQHVDLDVPRDKMSVFCGPSGSGKSSLAMDTLYAEGQRRYVESLSSYARQFLGQMPKPRVEHIHGLSPAIAIEQKAIGTTPRSTVGTVTEIYDYLRVLYARLGTQFCPDCNLPIETQTIDQVIERILALPDGTKLALLAPQEVTVGQKYEALWQRLQQQGFLRVRINGETHRLEDVPTMDRRRRHAVEVVVDRVKVTKAGRPRLAESVEAAFALGRGMIHVAHVDDSRPEPDWKVDRYSLHFVCGSCGRSFEQLSPHHFSFNSPLGWCEACEGLGTEQGTNLAALIADPRRSLRDGAIAAWPDPLTRPVFAEMLEAMAADLRLPLDVPYADLEPAQQRLVLYGTGDRWFEVAASQGGLINSPPSLREGPGEGVRSHTRTVDPPPTPPWKGGGSKTLPARGFRFQYKGLFPAVEEAARVSYVYRQRLQDLVGEVPCSACRGSRLRDDAAAVRFQGKTIQQACELPLADSLAFLKSVTLDRRDRKVAGDLLHEGTSRLSFLVEVGLHYLTLARTLPTLSGGEMQRIRLAGQIGRALTGVLYVLDEPTIGLHPRDNGRLLEALRKLRDLGNTLVLVEHDREILQAADRLYDFGPGAGRFGGTVVGQGTPKQLGRGKSLTGKYLAKKETIAIPKERRMPSVFDPPPSQGGGRGRVQGEGELPPSPNPSLEGRGVRPPRGVAGAGPKGSSERARTGASQSLQPQPPHDPRPSTLDSRLSTSPPGCAWLQLLGAKQHNLRDVDLRIPLGTFTCVTGVSGSGKSSLIEDTLAKGVARHLHRAGDPPGPFEELIGIEHINKVITVDQQPLGSTPASNPATYTGVFDEIRELFARLPEAKVRGYRPGRFSFNRPGGRCEDCEGNGQKRIEMHFLPDVWIECETCRGKRYNAETLAVKYRGWSIADVLDMSIGEAAELFDNIPKIRAYLATLCAIGLDYLTLGQPAPTLSGGEAQRVKLAAELARPQTGKTLYILDEPTTGLHFDDIKKLLRVLDSLVEAGNTVVVIEHNLDVIKTADWVIDLGPEAGHEGGWIVAEGIPEDIVAIACGQRPAESPDGPSSGMRSHTGEMLAPVLKAGRRAAREVFDAKAVARKRAGDLDLRQVGRDAKMPWQIDGRRWHTVDRVAHNGRPCRWEGEALAWLIDRLEEDDRLAAPDWSERAVVEVKGSDKQGSWFLHALTGDEWLLTLRFRVKKGTFDEAALARRLGLKAIDDLDQLPVYGRADRVRVKNLKGPYQEVTITVHWLEEIDTPEYCAFLKEAIAGFIAQSERAPLDLAGLTPWKVLGRKWHLSRKGFPSGKRVLWEAEALDALFDLLQEKFGDAAIDWGNKQVVHFRVGWAVPTDTRENALASKRRTRNGAGAASSVGTAHPTDAPASDNIIASVHTKRRGGIDLTLYAEAGRVTLGRIAGLGREREITPHRDGREAITIRFRTRAEVTALAELLAELWRSREATVASQAK